MISTFLKILIGAVLIAVPAFLMVAFDTDKNEKN